MKNIDDVLQGLISADRKVDRHGAKYTFYSAKLQAKQQILSDLLSIIGEDEEESKSWIPPNPALETVVVARNRLRHQIKSDIRKYMGVEE